MEEKSIHLKLAIIQNALKSPKDQKTNQYRFRNLEDINESVKPLALEQGCSVTYSDALIFHDGGFVECSATCYLCDGKETVSATSSTLMNTHPKFMSIEQSGGAASSYARKYAAQGLFAIDSSELDPDRTQGEPKKDALIEAKNALWRTVKEYSAIAGVDQTEEFNARMEGIANDPEAIMGKRNELLTEIRAADV